MTSSPSPPSVKLQKLLAQAGVASRREAEKLIVAGRVRVNNQPAHLGQRVIPGRDELYLDGKVIKSETKLSYFLVNKPVGLVSTTQDELGRQTVLELLPPSKRASLGRLYPVGRLDLQSQGLMLLTNDGALTQRLTHPRYRLRKTYQVQLDREPSRPALGRLSRGVKLKDGYVELDEWHRLDHGEGESWFSLTVHEGRHQLIRRLWRQLGYEVKTLIRVQLGPFHLDQLAGARWCAVTLPNDFQKNE